MGYMDTVEKAFHEQHDPAWVTKWKAEQRIEDRARELVAEHLREGKYVDVRPTSQQAAAIDEAYKLAGRKPDWTAILRAANERAARAAGLQYRDEVKRAEQAAEEQGD